MRQADVEVDRLRIWDFYLTFPNEARKIVFPKELIELKRIFKTREANPYEDLIDSTKIMERMKPYQMAALKCLASYDLIDTEELSKGVVKRTEKDIPKELSQMFENISSEKENILKLIVGFRELPLLGKAGLKYRTRLIDFKYDPH